MSTPGWVYPVHNDDEVITTSDRAIRTEILGTLLFGIGADKRLPIAVRELVAPSGRRGSIVEDGAPTRSASSSYDRTSKSGYIGWLPSCTIVSPSRRASGPVAAHRAAAAFRYSHCSRSRT